MIFKLKFAMPLPKERAEIVVLRAPKAERGSGVGLRTVPVATGSTGGFYG